MLIDKRNFRGGLEGQQPGLQFGGGEPGARRFGGLALQRDQAERADGTLRLAARQECARGGKRPSLQEIPAVNHLRFPTPLIEILQCVMARLSNCAWFHPVPRANIPWAWASSWTVANAAPSSRAEMRLALNVSAK
jgi:hypothetical protein